MNHPPKAIITAMVSHPPKALATLMARAAVDGADRILLARWGRSVTCGSLGEAEGWQARVIGKVAL